MRYFLNAPIHDSIVDTFILNNTPSMATTYEVHNWGTTKIAMREKKHEFMSNFLSLIDCHLCKYSPRSRKLRKIEHDPVAIDGCCESMRLTKLLRQEYMYHFSYQSAIYMKYIYYTYYVYIFQYWIFETIRKITRLYNLFCIANYSCPKLKRAFITIIALSFFF